MSKQGDAAAKAPGKLSRRVFVIVAAAILALGLAAGGYWYYMQQKSTTSKQQQAHVDAVKKLNNVAYRGDRNLAATYNQHIASGDIAGAYAVYADAITKAGDATKKSNLYAEAIQAAMSNHQIDQALQYALALANLAPSYRNSIAVADIYKAKKDTAHEKEYVQKALDQLGGLPHDSPEYKAAVPAYQQRLNTLGVQ